MIDGVCKEEQQPGEKGVWSQYCEIRHGRIVYTRLEARTEIL